MVKVSQRDLAIIAGLAGVADILTEHRFTIPLERAVKRIIRRGAPVAARGAAGFIPRAVGTARFIAMRHPYVTAAVVTYEVIKHREQIGQLLNEGWQVVEPTVTPILEEAAQMTTIPYPTGPGISAARTLPITERFLKKRKPSAFNKAVKAGMATVKKSKSYGGIGKIHPATTVFSIVTKLASAKKKKKKAPKKGIRRLIWNAMKGLR